MSVETSAYDAQPEFHGERLPKHEHERHPWVIAEIAPDFRLLDAWALPVQGGAEDFPALLELMNRMDPTSSDSSWPTRALFSLRHHMGSWFGWDDPKRKLSIPGCTETSLSARVPEQLRDNDTPPKSVSSSTFMPIYRTANEAAAEISNGTVHGVMHLGWVEQGDGVYRGRMSVYVKPRGVLGEAYMSLIGPFRHLIVYPAMMRQIQRAWDARHPPSG
ncbi:MAG TPA: DUF2867 domain-containing protein [Solirubrobacteraceae bacterium]|jgi:hypothetical protein